MSDGPYKSLNMNKGWKELAKRAAARSFSPDDIAAVVPLALHQDWLSEEGRTACKLARKLLLSGQTALFNDTAASEILSLRTGFAGAPLACLIFDHLAISVSNGLVGHEAITDAVTKALLERAARGGRQVEECYARHTNQKHAASVRKQIEEAIGRSDIRGLAQKLVNPDIKGPVVDSTQKHGIDDGAVLP